MARGVLRALVSAALVSAVAAAAFALLTPLRGAGRAYYIVAPEAVAVVFAVTAVGVLSGGAIRWRSAGRYAAVGIVGGGLVFAGVLLIFSAGLLLLAVGAVILLLAAAVALLRGVRALVNVVSAALCSMALGVLLYLTVLRPPVVACGPGGLTGMSAPSWWGGGASTSGAGGTRERTSGMIQDGDTTVTFTCEHGRLVELRTERRQGSG